MTTVMTMQQFSTKPWPRLGRGLCAGAMLVSLAACAPGEVEQESELTNGETETAEASEQTPEEATESAEPEEGSAAGDDEADDEPEPVSHSWIASDDDGEFEVTAEIGPIVRNGDQAIVVMKTEAPEGSDWTPDSFPLSGLGGGSTGVHPAQVRLVDSENMEVMEPARRSNGRYVVDHRTARDEELPSTQWAGVYGAPESDKMAVMVRELGLITDVPVVDGTVEDLPNSADWVSELAEESDLTADAYPIESYRENAALDLSTGEESGQSTVTIATDVLFDIDESELTAEADQALEAAVAEFGEVDGGELEIIGHTDNVLDEEYNQVLSEERAESVRARLEELTDLEAFDEVTTEGRSFNEPVASNDTEEGRALNRRVELHFTTPDQSQDAAAQEADLPEPEGPVGDAEDGVELTRDNDDNPVRVTVDSIQRVDNLFLGYITVEMLDPEGGSMGYPLTMGNRGYHPGTGGNNYQHTARAPTLLVGDQRLFPLSYALTSDEEAEDEIPTVRTLVDQNFGSGNYAQGETRTAALLWPALDVETVTVDVPSVTENLRSGTDTLNLNPWRITDVPVEGGSADDEADDESEDDETED